MLETINFHICTQQNFTGFIKCCFTGLAQEVLWTLRQQKCRKLFGLNSDNPQTRYVSHKVRA